MSTTGGPNIGGSLLIVHRVITRGLDVTIEHSQAFARDGFPDPTTREGFVSYAQSLVSFFHGHHITEDEEAWPRFRKRMPDAPYEELTADHRQFVPVLDEMKAATEAIGTGTGATKALVRLGAASREAQALWYAHIPKEEGLFSPDKVADVFSPEEHLEMIQAFSKHSQEHSGPPFLIAPFLLYNLSPEDRAIVAGGMPSAVTEELIPIVWKDKWAPMKPFLLC